MNEEQNTTPSFKELSQQEPRTNTPWRKRLLRAVVHLFVGIGSAILYYIALSLFFDTPVEHEMKRKSRLLNEQYIALEARYDSVEAVLYNVIDRDRAIFQNLFESTPYNFNEEFDTHQWEAQEQLLSRSNKELGKIFFERLNTFDKNAERELIQIVEIEQLADSLKDKLHYIPAIQPVINPDLTLLTASYGMLMHPFYKTLSSHQGVDFALSEGSRVFATADGRIKRIITSHTSSGRTVVIDHGNGYETSYSHLGKIYVRSGQRVRRGDIIAQSGNTGLSLAPHLHYEISLRGMRVDPIHYFFMELDQNDYQKIIKIAQSGMQSFD